MSFCKMQSTFAEILDANPTPFQGKSQDETDLERYCSRLKESYVTVTSEIEAYLSEVLKICEKVENYLKQKEEVESFEQKSQRLEKFDEFRDSVSETIKNEIGPKFDHLSQTIRHEVSHSFLYWKTEVYDCNLLTLEITHPEGTTERGRSGNGISAATNVSSGS